MAPYDPGFKTEEGFPGLGNAAIGDYKSSSIFSKLALQIFVLQLSAVAVLSLKAVSSESSGEIMGFGPYWWGIFFPCIIPAFVWLMALVVRERNEHVVRNFMILSSSIFFLGVISYLFFVEQEGNRNVMIFLFSYYIIICSASMSLMFISENFEDPRYNWVGITDLLVEGGIRGDILAMVPVNENGSLKFFASPGIGRSLVERRWERKGVESISIHMRQMGYLVKRSKMGFHGELAGSSYWCPATIEALLSQEKRGFNLQTSKEVESQSLASMLLAILSSEKKWIDFGVENLLSGTWDMGVIIKPESPGKIVHTWTPEELSRTAYRLLFVFTSIGKGKDRKEGVKEREEWVKKGIWIDFDGDEKITNWERMRTIWEWVDLNKDGRRDFKDVIVGLGMILMIIFRKSELDHRNESVKKIISKMIEERPGDGVSSEVEKHLILGYIVCLASLAQNAASISEISWREAAFFYSEMAEIIQKHVENDESLSTNNKKGERSFRTFNESLPNNIQGSVEVLFNSIEFPVRNFAMNYDAVLDLAGDSAGSREILFKTTKNMIDRIDVEKYGTPSAELLERRKGTIIGASMALGSYRNYLDSIEEM